MKIMYDFKLLTSFRIWWKCIDGLLHEMHCSENLRDTVMRMKGSALKLMCVTTLFNRLSQTYYYRTHYFAVKRSLLTDAIDFACVLLPVSIHLCAVTWNSGLGLTNQFIQQIYEHLLCSRLWTWHWGWRESHLPSQGDACSLVNEAIQINPQITVWNEPWRHAHGLGALCWHFHVPLYLVSKFHTFSLLAPFPLTQISLKHTVKNRSLEEAHNQIDFYIWLHHWQTVCPWTNCFNFSESEFLLL